VTDRALTVTMGVLATLGLAVAGYLVYVHYAGIAPVCAIAHGCEKVQSSQWSKLAGIPVADIGAAGYLAILGSLLVPGESGRLAGLAFTTVGFGFSAWLTYCEIAKIHAICPWCVTSAVLMTLLMVVAAVRFLRAGDEAGAPSRRALRA
jgi:uncharacterized membrane protein